MRDFIVGAVIGFLPTIVVILFLVYHLMVNELARKPPETAWREFRKTVGDMMKGAPFVLAVVSLLVPILFEFEQALSFWPYLLRFTGILAGIEAIGAVFWVLADRAAKNAASDL